MVAQRLLTRGAEGEGKGAVTLEVAHEALLRRKPIEGWLAEQKDALKLRDDVLREAKEWETGGRHADFVRRGTRLDSALDLAGQPSFAATLAAAKAYLAEGRRLEAASRKRTRRVAAAIFVLMAGVIASLLGVIFKAELEQLAFEWTTERNFVSSRVRPHLLTTDAEHVLAAQPGKTFSECEKNCPEMVVLPRGTFWMGSPDGEGNGSEHPRRQVKIDYPIAVGKYTVTWDEYELCVAMRGCDKPFGDAGFERGRKPVINVSWEDAQKYVAWLSRITGKPYRLLSEAEWEYAARGIVSTDAPHPKYFWGDGDKDICTHANLADQSFSRRYSGDAVDCDDKFENTAPVGQFPANVFGLHDMAGNVWQWVEDPWHGSFSDNPPRDGSVWQGGDPKYRVVRGGSWSRASEDLRAAARGWDGPGLRSNYLGFRVARVLFPPRTL
jgi:formylglycine-generating enzyme required for sulfatase activity